MENGLTGSDLGQEHMRGLLDDSKNEANISYQEIENPRKE